MTIKHLSLFFVILKYCQYAEALASFMASTVIVLINIVLQLTALIHLPHRLTLVNLCSLINWINMSNILEYLLVTCTLHVYDAYSILDTGC